MLNLIRLRDQTEYLDSRRPTGAQTYAACSKQSASIFCRFDGMLGHGLITAQPDSDDGKLDHSEVVGGMLLEAGSDAAEMVGPIEEALNSVALSIEYPAEAVAVFACHPLGDVGATAEDAGTGERLVARWPVAASDDWCGEWDPKLD